ncbi:MAG TPA: hypothetical protein DCS93_35655 [Microscillaceae bacterium]|nr:hypothetical protein [Microscillaceae bacterium]
MDETNLPVIFVVFANPDQDLRLSREEYAIRRALKEAERQGLCKLEIRINAGRQEIFEVFLDPAFQNRIAIFHYAGHATYEELFLQEEKAYAEPLMRFLARQDSLQLVFLNACFTLKQAKQLNDEGVPVVIATLNTVDDLDAAEVANLFYQSLGKGETIHKSFKNAVDFDEALVRPSNQAANRGSKKLATQTSAHSRKLWEIYSLEKEDLDWALIWAKNDPFFGLPDLPPNEYALPRPPFVSLKYYTENEAAVFFGRGWKVRELYTQLTNTDTSSLTLLFGQSGAGKSSLLNAGVIPRLKIYHKVYWARYEASKGLMGTFCQAIRGDKKTILDAQGLMDEWHRIEIKLKRPVIVVLDQLEELFTQNDTSKDKAAQELQEFIEVLQTLLKSNKVQATVLLSFRKEYLAEIEKPLVKNKVSYNKHFLDLLTKADIHQVVNGLASNERLRDEYRLTIDPELATAVSEALQQQPSNLIAPILQIALSEMWKNVDQQDNPHFTKALFAERLFQNLEDFLEDQLNALPTNYQEAYENGLVYDVLNFHVSEETTAQRWPEDQVLARYHHPDHYLKGLLLELDKLRLLNVTNHQSSALAHDTLAPVVQKVYKLSTKPGQRATQILEGKLNIKDPKRYFHYSSLVKKIGLLAGLKAEEKRLIYLNYLEVQIVTRGRKGMKAWEQAEIDLVRQSKNKLLASLGEKVTVALVVLVTLFFTVKYQSDAAKGKQTIGLQQDTIKTKNQNIERQRLLLEQQQDSLDKTLSVVDEKTKLAKQKEQEAQRAESKAKNAQIAAQAQNLALISNQLRNAYNDDEALRLAKYAYQSTQSNPSAMVTYAYAASFYAWLSKQSDHPIWKEMLLPSWQATKAIPFHQQFYEKIVNDGRELSVEDLKSRAFKSKKVRRSTTSLVYLKNTDATAYTTTGGDVFIKGKLLPDIKAKKLFVSPKERQLAALSMDGKKLYIINGYNHQYIAKSSPLEINEVIFLNERTLLLASNNQVYRYTIGQKSRLLFKASFRITRLLGSPFQNYLMVANSFSNQMEVYNRNGALVLSSPHNAIGRTEINPVWSKSAFSLDEKEIYVEIREGHQPTKVLVLPLPKRIHQLLQEYPLTNLTPGDRRKHGIK